MTTGRAGVTLVALGLFALPGLAGAAPAKLHVATFAQTGIRLTGVVWTGKQMLYVENTTNQIFSSAPGGGALQRFAKLPRHVEETRCVVVPQTAHGWTAGDIYCHIPDNRIYRIGAGGKTAKLVASLPTTVTSDGMLALDTVGKFGYRLVASTGRSGSSSATGGDVYTVDAAGNVQHVGSYAGPGGADNLAVAPATFGSVAGWALLTVDPGPNAGTVVAVSPTGRTRTVATLPDGPNPIVVLPPSGAPAGSGSSPASPGLYLSDTLTRAVYYVAAPALAPYAGSVLVGGELSGRLWVVKPAGSGFATQELPSDMPGGGKHNLEGAAYVP